MNIPIIDTHVHLDEIAEPKEAILEAKKAGVSGIVAVGMDIASNEKILTFSRQYPNVVFPALGYHPWKVSISGIRDNLDFLRLHLDQAVALGEVGLDYKSSIPKELQEAVFKDLLELAWERNKPVIVHSRLSHEETFTLVRKHDLKKVVFHWYSGPKDILKELLLLGYYISATPALVYSPKHREAVTAAPLKQILIETDAPTVYQGVVSSPAQVLKTLTELSRMKGMDIEEAALKTTQNARDFFGIT
ncbi:MAG: TatD family hydrolase [Thermodesulfobacteriota bacterium]|jgi:TatD DNase family protein